MGPGRTVEADEFREALAPMVADIRVFTLEVDAVGPRHGSTPWEHSPAMRELADEPGYQERCSWTGPITDTHMLGGLTLQAAADYVRTFAASFTTESVPMWGHLVVARSALESSVVSWWLSDPGIARDERVKRGLSEFLYSASEVFRLKIRADGGEQVKEWIAHAAGLGWAATDYDGEPWKPRSRGTPRVNGVERPSIPQGITRLLVTDTDAKIGKLLWSKLSAVSHVTYFGLESAMLLEDAAPTLSPDVKTVPVGTNSTSVRQQAFCVVRALREAATARFALMGGRTTRGKPPATSLRTSSSNCSIPIRLASPHRPTSRPRRRTHQHVRAQPEIGRWRVASGPRFHPATSISPQITSAPESAESSAPASPARAATVTVVSTCCSGRIGEAVGEPQMPNLCISKAGAVAATTPTSGFWFVAEPGLRPELPLRSP